MFDHGLTVAPRFNKKPEVASRTSYSVFVSLWHFVQHGSSRSKWRSVQVDEAS